MRWRDRPCVGASVLEAVFDLRGPGLDPGLKVRVCDEEVDGVSDDCIVDVEEDHEVLLRLLDKVLHLLLKGAHKSVVRL